MKAVKQIATIATLAAISTTASQAATGAQNAQEIGNAVYQGVTNNKVTQFVQGTVQQITDVYAAERGRPRAKTPAARRGGRHNQR